MLSLFRWRFSFFAFTREAGREVVVGEITEERTRKGVGAGTKAEVGVRDCGGGGLGVSFGKGRLRDYCI